jgi:hypothetical protein
LISLETAFILIDKNPKTDLTVDQMSEIMNKMLSMKRVDEAKIEKMREEERVNIV